MMSAASEAVVWFEIVAPGASGEAIFIGVQANWLLAFKMDTMVTRGRLSIHFRKPPELPKERGEGSESHEDDGLFRHNPLECFFAPP